MEFRRYLAAFSRNSPSQGAGSSVRLQQRRRRVGVGGALFFLECVLRLGRRLQNPGDS
jgi:hypothetical protein